MTDRRKYVSGCGRKENPSKRFRRIRQPYLLRQEDGFEIGDEVVKRFGNLASKNQIRTVPKLLTIVNEVLDQRLRMAAEGGEILDRVEQLRAEGLSVGEIHQRLDEKFGPVGKGKEG